MNWWQIIPVGSTLVEVDQDSGDAVFDNGNQRWIVDLFSDSVTALPPAGWGVSAANGRRTWTVYGSSINVTPPTRHGYECRFVARHGDRYTTWTYKSVGES